MPALWLLCLPSERWYAGNEQDGGSGTRLHESTPTNQENTDMPKHNPKPTILIVDDEKANLLALNAILSPDYAVAFAKSGGEALRLAAEIKPDLILLDIIMPDISGFETLERLKESAETMFIPVIFITGLDSEHDEEKGFTLGAVDYIKKPFKSIIVKARVNTQMQIVRQMRSNTLIGAEFLRNAAQTMESVLDSGEEPEEGWRNWVRDIALLVRTGLEALAPETPDEPQA